MSVLETSNLFHVDACKWRRKFQIENN